MIADTLIEQVLDGQSPLDLLTEVSIPVWQAFNDYLADRFGLRVQPKGLSDQIGNFIFDGHPGGSSGFPGAP